MKKSSIVNWKPFIVIGLLMVGAGCASSGEAPGSPIVDLKNGDTYSLSADYVTRQIGGK